MKHQRVYEFVENLDAVFIELLGQPTIHFHTDEVEVYFDSDKVIRYPQLLQGDCDDFRMFANDKGGITFVYTFWDEQKD